MTEGFAIAQTETAMETSEPMTMTNAIAPAGPLPRVEVKIFFSVN